MRFCVVSRIARADAPTDMRTLGNPSLLMLLTSAIAACSGSGEVFQSDAGGGHDAAVPGDANSTADASVSGNAFPGVPDAQADAPSDAATDAGDAGCPPSWTSDFDGGCVPITVRRPFLVGASMRVALAVRSDD